MQEVQRHLLREPQVPPEKGDWFAMLLGLILGFIIGAALMAAFVAYKIGQSLDF
jgi:hypothetical protein